MIPKITNCVAGAGLCLPAWWPKLATISEGAAVLVPILSAVWLATQIVKAWSR